MSVNVDDVDDEITDTGDQSGDLVGHVAAPVPAVPLAAPVLVPLPPPTGVAVGIPPVNPSAPVETVAVPQQVATGAVSEPLAATVAAVRPEATPGAATPKAARPGRRSQERAGRTAEMPVVKASRFLGRGKSAATPTPDYTPHELRESVGTPVISHDAATVVVQAGASPLPPPLPVDERRSPAAPVPETTGHSVQASPNATLAPPLEAPAAAPLPAHALAAPPSTSAVAAGRTALPSNLGMVSVDRVRFAREQAPSRAVQRLAIDLDGAQVAVRVHHDRVAVEVVDDPSGALGAAWAKQVERSLDQAVRTVSEPQRNDALPQPQRNDSSPAHDSNARDDSRRDRPSPDSGEQGQPRRWQRAFSMLTEEED